VIWLCVINLLATTLNTWFCIENIQNDLPAHLSGATAVLAFGCFLLSLVGIAKGVDR